VKLTKFVASAVVATALTALVTTSFAGSIGRSGGSSRSSSSSMSKSSSSSASRSSSYSAPSKPAPAVAPAPAKSGGIGGTTSSVGVRKNEVTNGVRNDVAATKSAPSGTSSGSSGSYSSGYAPTPTYGAPAVPQPQVTNGSTFMSSLGGSFAGTVLGNALFNNHGSHGGGTTVINNGTPGGSAGGVVASGPGAIPTDAQFNPSGVNVQPKKEYTVWSFIADVFGFVIVVALLLGVAWLFYKGFQLVRKFINKERGVSSHPFNPTQQFWTIQKAFASADVGQLQTLLGPDVVDELTNGLAPSTMTLHNVSHEIRLSNNTEFSIWYRFEDDGAEVNQVWHYEKFGKDWKLNGIENV
jgi:hypothetical protein